MRKIGIIAGSNGDLPQCLQGLGVLKDLEAGGEVDVLWVKVRSVHRNTLLLLQLLDELAALSVEEQPDVLIIGAGWANHLTGTADAYLRYTLKNDHIVVVGVAFEDEKEERHTAAAILSITEVPGTQVVFQDMDGKPFVGRKGFEMACLLAAQGKLPKIVLKDGKPPLNFTLLEALARAEERKGA